MSENNQIGADNGFESIASRMIEKWPRGHITAIEIGWPCKSTIRAPVAGLDTPVAIFTGSYQELNAFEHAFHRARRAAKESESIRPAGKWPVDKMLGEA
jgi:hypothetical protein